jgi:hypothetical protein
LREKEYERDRDRSRENYDKDRHYKRDERERERDRQRDRPVVPFGQRSEKSASFGTTKQSTNQSSPQLPITSSPFSTDILKESPEANFERQKQINDILSCKKLTNEKIKVAMKLMDLPNGFASTTGKQHKSYGTNGKPMIDGGIRIHKQRKFRQFMNKKGTAPP